VTLVGVKDKPGIAASIFKPLSKNSINVDMVVQNISSNGRETDLTFTIKNDDLNKTKKIVNENKNINFKKLIFDKNVSKISIIGVGMVTTPGVTFRMFQALANQKINIQVISTSEIKISVLVDKKNIRKAISALHKEFKLHL
jgi:Aspartokinases